MNPASAPVPHPRLEPYRAWLHDSVSPIVQRWFPSAADRRYESASAEFLQRTTDDAASRRYAAACPVGDLDHTQYRLRELRLPFGATLLAGVHFRGLATEYPFVGVFAQSRWLTAHEMGAAHAALLRDFAVFSPRASWWWLPAGRDVPQAIGARPDQHLVMGSLEEIRASSTVPLPSGWRLRRLESAGEVERAFAELYRDFHEARPDLAPVVPASASEALVECARAEGLYACFAGTEVAAVVAAKPEAQYSVDAWVMWDIVLARKYCGQGLAPSLQRAVLERLDAARAPLVLGTINARNLPSLRTALRVGRRIVGTWIFLDG